MRNNCRYFTDDAFENKRYCDVAAAIGVAGVAGIASSAIQADSSSRAAKTQSQAADRQIAEARRQFDEIQKLLSPYTQAGNEALNLQKSMLGLNSPDAQYAALKAIQDSPQMAALTQQGENAILQNASATGGLRGGNTQGALAQFRPQLLNSLIEQQYGKLAGLSNMGQAAAAGVGNAQQATSSQVIGALGQQGQAQAGGILGRGQAGANLLSGLSGAAGLAYGSGLGGNLFGTPGLNSGFDLSTGSRNIGFNGSGLGKNLLNMDFTG